MLFPKLWRVVMFSVTSFQALIDCLGEAAPEAARFGDWGRHLGR